MIVFDLREEARLITYLYPIGACALAFAAAALAPLRLRRRLPEALADSVRPLAVIFGLVTAGLVWVEYDERRQAEALVELCLAGGCTVVEGEVSDVEPVHKISSGGRYTQATYGGYFRIGDTLFAHYPRDFSSYSPANHLRDGDRARAYQSGETLVLVDLTD
ncbi:hypothetical protein [Magnetospirillum sp. UT-4]|uniref:hypothetical protein n=1 Tax=Magnetospirillum sp. UT-4 TaxID=2681467 RepID=UPI00137EC0C0|nr:hypothetical protein [Magnetospirillum sp. UT-4]CAA7616535.1 hypothetical protein MTBUT4_230002 [Magnetospirillum sp. UT-4]